jgi:hypothetical protein
VAFLLGDRRRANRTCGLRSTANLSHLEVCINDLTVQIHVTLMRPNNRIYGLLYPATFSNNSFYRQDKLHLFSCADIEGVDLSE